MDTSFDFDIKEVIIKHEMDKTVEIDAQVLAECVGDFVRSLDRIRSARYRAEFEKRKQDRPQEPVITTIMKFGPAGPRI